MNRAIIAAIVMAVTTVVGNTPTEAQDRQITEEQREQLELRLVRGGIDALELFGDPEVEQLDRRRLTRALARDHDVGRLEIAMDDCTPVRVPPTMK